MRLSEDLQHLTSIVAEAGLPDLAGEMMAYALAQPQSYWEDGRGGEEHKEPHDPMVRAIEFLRLQLVVSERQIMEAEVMAAELHKGSLSQFVFVPPSERYDEDYDREFEGEPAKVFAQEKRGELWSSKRRTRVTDALDILLARILEEADPEYGTDGDTH